MTYSAARDGWTVKMLADLLSSYAKNNPDAIVEFVSSENGGRWPEGKGRMGVFIDHQVHITDSRLCGGEVLMTLALLSFRKEANPGKRTLPADKAEDLIRQMTAAVTIAHDVLQSVRISSMNQNPKGFRDLIGSAAYAGQQALKELG